MEYKNLTKIFKIVEKETDQVVIEVKSDDLLLCAKYPFIDGEYKYITVTRTKKCERCYDYILTVLKSNGTSFKFDWGYSGFTLISKSSETLKENVMKFIHSRINNF